jgi:hypothetical protein
MDTHIECVIIPDQRTLRRATGSSAGGCRCFPSAQAPKDDDALELLFTLRSLEVSLSFGSGSQCARVQPEIHIETSALYRRSAVDGKARLSSVILYDGYDPSPS